MSKPGGFCYQRARRFFVGIAFVYLFVSNAIGLSFDSLRGLTPVELRPEYHAIHRRFEYQFDEIALQKYNVFIEEGKVYAADSKSGEVRLFSSYVNTPSIYVVTQDGQFRISAFSQKNKFTHATLGGGRPILAAGEIFLKDGRILAINFESGHYKPPYANLPRFIEILRVDGVSLSEDADTEKSMRRVVDSSSVCGRAFSSQML